MKKSFLFYFAAFCLLCLSSCEKKPAPIDDNGEEAVEYVEVGLRPKGVDISVSPMNTKAGSSDGLYGVSIFKNLNTSQTTYAIDAFPYAAWLTDDLSSETIKLVTGAKYYCYVVYIPNGKSVLADYDSGHYPPFATMDRTCPKLGDGVCYGGNYSAGGYNDGAARKKGDVMSSYFSTGYYFNDVEKYQGETEIEANANITIDVNLYKVMYALNVSVKNFSEGSIKIYSPMNEGIDNNVISLSPSNPSISKVLTFDNYAYASNNNGWPEGTSFIGPDYYGITRFEIEYTDSSNKTFSVMSVAYDGWDMIPRMSRINIEIDLEELLANVNAGLNANIVQDGEWKDIYLSPSY